MSNNSKAVITLQVGHYANYVGTHFWNSQELSFNVPKDKNDIDHDVLHREGATLDHVVTYMPRLISVDLKGALGSLPQFGDLYHEVGGISTAKTDLSYQAAENWHSKLDVTRAEAHRKTTFLRDLEAEENLHDEGKEIDVHSKATEERFNAEDTTLLDEEVQLWSDFLRTRFHPKSNVVMEEYTHRSATDPFDIHGVGVQAWSNHQSSLADDVEDRIRFFVEEADFFRGFQIIHDSADGFGGVSSMISQYIKDEFGAQTLLSFPTIPTHYDQSLDAMQALTKLLNIALTFKSATEFCDLITPLSLASDTFYTRRMEPRACPNIQYRQDLHYHTSALLASGLDTLSMPWRRLDGNYVSPWEVSSGLSAFGRKVANVYLGAPVPRTDLDFDFLKSSLSLTPHTNNFEAESVWSQSVSFRGRQDPKLSIMEMLDQSFPKTLSAMTTSKCAMQVGAPYPSHMFSPISWSDPTEKKTIPTVTLWQSSRGSGNILQSLVDRCARINLNKLHKFQDAGLDQDGLLETIEDLSTLSDCYKNPSDAH